MQITTFTVGPFSQNTYLIENADEAILIDPGFFDPREYEPLQDHLSASGKTLLAVLLTHAHVDHVLGLDKVLKNHDVPVYLNHTDLHLWENFPNQARMFGFNSPGFDFVPEPLDEMTGFQLGKFTFDVLYTPGHSPDHISLYFKDDEILIAGDALFRESIGRTDLYEGNFEQLAASIREKLYTLPDATTVYSGHGPSTTIGHEKVNNAFVKMK
ncbi:MAG: MBL fold metallo-hydrolase [Balneolaceae bacterium]|nr:MBL fold metallo-hydrolase [Balneolaceae bacterium]